MQAAVGGLPQRTEVGRVSDNLSDSDTSIVSRLLNEQAGKAAILAKKAILAIIRYSARLSSPRAMAGASIVSRIDPSSSCVGLSSVSLAL